MGVKLRVFTIALERPQAGYRPGEVVNGQCIIALDGAMNLNQLEISLKCKAYTHWTTSETHRTGTGSSHSDTVHHSERVYCLDLLYFHDRNVLPPVLNPGQHNIPFSFPLPQGPLPSNFESHWGYIRWYLKARVIKTAFFAFDDVIHQPLTMQAPAYIPIHVLRQPSNVSNVKMSGLFSKKKIVLNCGLQRIGYNLGEEIPITCFIENESKKNMSLRATLKQEVCYRAHARHRILTEKMTQTTGPTISGESKHTEVIAVPIPVNIPIVSNSCPIIDIKYYLSVTLDIPNAFDLHCSLPLIITNEVLNFDT